MATASGDITTSATLLGTVATVVTLLFRTLWRAEERDKAAYERLTEELTRRSAELARAEVERDAANAALLIERMRSAQLKVDLDDARRTYSHPTRHALTEEEPTT